MPASSTPCETRALRRDAWSLSLYDVAAFAGIGQVKREMFIWGDEEDFAYRVKHAGIRHGTFVGASELIVSLGETPQELRRRVTSPKGTTERALKSAEEQARRDDEVFIARAPKRAELAPTGGEQE